MQGYDLILSHDPCYIFQHYGVEEMHGLNLKDCKAYNNTSEDSYISGWCNYVPKQSDRMFVFINLSRCTNDLNLITTLNHEMIHYAFAHYNWDIKYEEEIITLAEEEVKKIYKIIKNKNE